MSVAEQLVARLLLIWVIALLHYILLPDTAKGCTKDQKQLRCMGHRSVDPNKVNCSTDTHEGTIEIYR